MHKTGVTWSLILFLVKTLTAASWMVCICNRCVWKASLQSIVVIKVTGYKSISNKHFGWNLKWLLDFILVIMSVRPSVLSFVSSSGFSPTNQDHIFSHALITLVVTYGPKMIHWFPHHFSFAELVWVLTSALSTYLIRRAGLQAPLWMLDCLFNTGCWKCGSKILGKKACLLACRDIDWSWKLA